MNGVKRSTPEDGLVPRDEGQEGFNPVQMAQLQQLQNGIVGQMSVQLSSVATQLGDRIGQVEQDLAGRFNAQAEINADILSRLAALEMGGVGGSTQTEHSPLDLYIKFMGDVGVTDKEIEKNIQAATGDFATIGCTVKKHVHPRRNSKARYTHMALLHFDGVAEKAYFEKKWSEFDETTQKWVSSLKVEGVETLIGVPMEPAMARMLGELLEQKDKLVETMGIDGSTLKFQLKDGTIKDAGGKLLYVSGLAKN